MTNCLCAPGEEHFGAHRVRGGFSWVLLFFCAQPGITLYCPRHLCLIASHQFCTPVPVALFLLTPRQFVRIVRLSLFNWIASHCTVKVHRHLSERVRLCWETCESETLLLFSGPLLLVETLHFPHVLLTPAGAIECCPRWSDPWLLCQFATHFGAGKSKGDQSMAIAICFAKHTQTCTLSSGHFFHHKLISFRKSNLFYFSLFLSLSLPFVSQSFSNRTVCKCTANMQLPATRATWSVKYRHSWETTSKWPPGSKETPL